MEKLVRGIHRFQSDVFSSQRELFERLARSQDPDALLITCSDSRINPSLITQTEPGDLFVLRNAGNIVPPHGNGVTGEAATIEFAVAGLAIEDIIVCGHTGCGAIEALLDPKKTETLPAVRAWLGFAECTRRIVSENYSHLEGDHLLMAAIEENVLCQLDNLRTIPVVASRIAAGKLHLHAWVYAIESGAVFAYSPESSDFLPIAEVGGAPAVTRRMHKTQRPI